MRGGVFLLGSDPRSGKHRRDVPVWGRADRIGRQLYRRGSRPGLRDADDHPAGLHVSVCRAGGGCRRRRRRRRAVPGRLGAGAVRRQEPARPAARPTPDRGTTSPAAASPTTVSGNSRSASSRRRRTAATRQRRCRSDTTRCADDYRRRRQQASPTIDRRATEQHPGRHTRSTSVGTSTPTRPRRRPPDAQPRPVQGSEPRAHTTQTRTRAAAPLLPSTGMSGTAAGYPGPEGQPFADWTLCHGVVTATPNGAATVQFPASSLGKPRRD